MSLQFLRGPFRTQGDAIAFAVREWDAKQIDKPGTLDHGRYVCEWDGRPGGRPGGYVYTYQRKRRRVRSGKTEIVTYWEIELGA